MNEGMAAWRVCSHRPIGRRREACGAWPGFEPTRRVKLVARAASGRAGLAVAGDLAGEWAARIRKTGDPKTAGDLCVMGDLNPQPAD